MLQWPQAKKLLPALFACAANDALASTMEDNLKSFFAQVGPAFRKPACASLLRNLPVKQAADIAGVKVSYIHDSRSKKYVFTDHRLFNEKYAVGTNRVHIHQMEVTATRDWARSALGGKSGQTDDTCFLYDAKDVFYHEKYQRYAQ